jgi:hypothetical protein
MSSAVAATSVASERSPIQPVRNAARPDVTMTASAIRASGRARQVLGWLVDMGLLLLLALAFPLVVLVMGAPIALVVRLLIEIDRR